MNIEKKWVYLSVAAIFLVLISFPSALLIDSFKSYFGFLDTWSAGAVHPGKVETLPPPPPRTVKARLTPAEIKFTEFSYASQKAGAVMISADFNRWTPEAFEMHKSGKGQWKGTVPLPKGTYHYLFVVDGKEILDPKNSQTVSIGGKKVSVINVK